MDKLGEALGIDTPHHIEAFDNSNIQGADPVAAMVTFIDGKPSKKDYRKYKVRSVKGPDDYASMKEVVRRRYLRLLKEQSPLPDLIVIDGGKGQLSAAQSVLKDELDLLTLLLVWKKMKSIKRPSWLWETLLSLSPLNGTAGVLPLAAGAR